MINSTVIVSDAKFFADDFKINPYYSDTPINPSKAQQEHHLIVESFKQAGIKVIQVPAPPHCQDGVYTANWALVKDRRAIISRLPKARQEEEHKISEEIAKRVAEKKAAKLAAEAEAAKEAAAEAAPQENEAPAEEAQA